MVERSPARPDIWVQLGHARKEAGDLAAAEVCYLRALAIDPDSSDGFLHFGHLKKLQGRVPEATIAYVTALRLNAGCEDAGAELQRLAEGAPPAPVFDARVVFRRRARRSWSNLRKTPLDFRLFGAAQPDVSIIIPVFNQIEMTSHCLACVYFACAYMRQTSGRTSEVLVVDNGSNDGTPELLATFPGLVRVREDAPIGFPRAVNLGAARAKGAILIVANNDIEFAPDALSHLCDRLDADPGVAVVGGLTIRVDETLQEAGSFLASTGEVTGLGTGETPSNGYFEGVHEADFCTGCLIAVRGGEFAALGGLDEDFSPGYYEETDFCFRAKAELGKRSVIDSKVQISHFEHASFSHEATYPSKLRNRARFVHKHRERLALHPDATALSHPGGVRIAAPGRARVLAIAETFSAGDEADTALRRLRADGVPVDLLVLSGDEAGAAPSDPSVTVYFAAASGEDLAAALSRIGPRYSHLLVAEAATLERHGALIEAAERDSGLRVAREADLASMGRAPAQPASAQTG